MNARYLTLEVARQLRNVRSLVFTFALPVVMLLIFGSAYGDQTDASTSLPWLVVTTVQMAAYGAMMAALSQAFSIVNERALGWNRQLRITPLSGTGYLVSKVVSALSLAAVAVILVVLVAVLALHASLGFSGWLAAGVGIWLGVIPFALLSILIGQFARPEFAQPLFMATFFGLAILGGLWIPLQILPSWVASIGHLTPSYWLDRLGQVGALGSGALGAPALVLGAWTVGLGLIVVWRYRRDAARA